MLSRRSRPGGIKLKCVMTLFGEVLLDITALIIGAAARAFLGPRRP